MTAPPVAVAQAAPEDQFWSCELDASFTIQPLFDIWGTNLPMALPSYEVLRDLDPSGAPLSPQTYASLPTVYDPFPADPLREARYDHFTHAYNILSITRVDEDGSTHPLITAPVPISAPTMRFIDVEVPLDLQFRYQIYTDVDPLTPAFTEWCSVPSTAWAPDYPRICVPVLLSDPILVARATWVGLQSIESLSWAGRRTVYDIVSAVYPIAQSEVRSAPRTNIRVFTFTLAERTLFLRVLSSGRILLMRIPDPSYPESFWYISIGDVTEERVLTDHRRPERRWVLDVAVVQRPEGDISFVGSDRTYTTLRDYEPDAVTPITPRSYAGVHADYLDYMGATLGLGQSAPSVQANGLGLPVGQVYTPNAVGRMPTANAVAVTQWKTTP